MKVTKGRSSASFRLLPSLFVVFFLFVITAVGQQAWVRLQGVVKDAHGAIVTKAAVVLTGNETGVKLTTATDSAGLFSFRWLNPGSYSHTYGGKYSFSQTLTNATGTSWIPTRFDWYVQ